MGGIAIAPKPSQHLHKLVLLTGSGGKLGSPKPRQGTAQHVRGGVALPTILGGSMSYGLVEKADGHARQPRDRVKRNRWMSRHCRYVRAGRTYHAWLKKKKNKVERRRARLNPEAVPQYGRYSGWES